MVDVGGTNTRCAVAGADGRLLHPARYANREHEGLAPLLAGYLAALPATGRPRRGAIAIAAVIRGDGIEMTNLSWSFSVEAMRRTLGLDRLEVLNDFEALAHSLPFLGEHELARIGGGTPVEGAPRVVLGPGTGLGVAGLLSVDGRAVVVSSEGGHATMAACDALETKLVEAARIHYGHASAERLLSGPGLSFIHGTLHGAEQTPVGIGQALEAGDAAARQTYRVFFRMLGTIAANLALTFGAFGGVYVGGGIAPRYLDTLKDAGFRERFEDKGRYRAYLTGIPTWVITAKQPALTGLAAWTRARQEG